MDIRGIWKVKEAHIPTPEGVRIFTPDTPPTEDRFDGFAEVLLHFADLVLQRGAVQVCNAVETVA